ncbi:HU family DNA-binding protein, partial [Neobacillus cucumis]|uniref:HU family DNA-binding protein n=1 Tax=Neobacillus cucumis TaxID=1740721 RepID=UPI0036068420
LPHALRSSPPGTCEVMAPKAMKAMKASGKALTKGGLAEAIAGETELKKRDCVKVLDSLAAVAAKQVKSAGKVTIPGLCMIKTRVKPATKAGKREIFGKMVVVKAKPAKTVVKAFCVAALKKSV